MKYTRKILSLLLALIMMLSLAVTAMATAPDQTEDPQPTTYTITIRNNNAGHTYEAYQIFTGDLSDNKNVQTGKSEFVLSNIKFSDTVTYKGNGVQIGTEEDGDPIMSKDPGDLAAALDKGTLKLDDFLADLTFSAAFASTNTHADSTATNDPDDIPDHYSIAGLPAGYYLVKDQDGSQSDKSDAYTEYIIQVIGDTNIKNKASVPQVEKKVADTNDTTGETEDDLDSADYDIGDDVPFILTATLGDELAAYSTYKVTFHDTLDKGLELNAEFDADMETKVVSGVTVTLLDKDESDITNGTDITAFFNITAVTAADDKTTLTITCADIKDMMQDGNKILVNNNDKIVVTYTAKLTVDANVGSAGNRNTVYLEYSNNPNWTGTGTTPTGKTPEDTVIVFTYEVDVNKTDTGGSALTGASFELFKKILLKQGETAENSFTEGDKTYYWKSLGELPGQNAAATSEFAWSGIDDGIYKLVETQTPAGYNDIDPIEFTVTATHTQDTAEGNIPPLSLMNLSGTVAGESAENPTFQAQKDSAGEYNGKLKAAVENRPGAVLPETGGMGTTILYIAGGILVLAAIVLLVTKKRMTSAE